MDNLFSMAGSDNFTKLIILLGAASVARNTVDNPDLCSFRQEQFGPRRAGTVNNQFNMNADEQIALWLYLVIRARG